MRTTRRVVRVWPVASRTLTLTVARSERVPWRRIRLCTVRLIVSANGRRAARASDRLDEASTVRPAPRRRDVALLTVMRAVAMQAAEQPTVNTARPPSAELWMLSVGRAPGFGVAPGCWPPPVAPGCGVAPGWAPGAVPGAAPGAAPPVPGAAGPGAAPGAAPPVPGTAASVIVSAVLFVVPPPRKSSARTAGENDPAVSNACVVDAAAVCASNVPLPSKSQS